MVSTIWPSSFTSAGLKLNFGQGRGCPTISIFWVIESLRAARVSDYRQVKVTCMTNMPLFITLTSIIGYHVHMWHSCQISATVPPIMENRLLKPAHHTLIGLFFFFFLKPGPLVPYCKLLRAEIKLTACCDSILMEMGTSCCNLHRLRANYGNSHKQ